MRFECGWCNVRPKNRGNARARASEVKCETKSRGPFTKALNARVGGSDGKLAVPARSGLEVAHRPRPRSGARSRGRRGRG